MLVKTYYNNDLSLRVLPNGKKDFDIAINVGFVRQKLKENILTWRGECFNNLNIGFPYNEQVFITSPDLILIKNSFRETIESVPGIRQVIELNLDFDKKARTLYVKFTCVLVSGENFTIDSRSDQDFIILI